MQCQQVKASLGLRACGPLKCESVVLALRALASGHARGVRLGEAQ